MNQAQQRLCNKCFTPLEPGVRFCSECGAPAPQQVVGLCPNCGQEIMEGQQACYSCGTLIKAVVVGVEAPPPQKKKKSLPTGAWMSILAVLLVAIIAVAVVLLFQPQEAQSVELRRDELTLLPGERMELRWQVLPENTPDKSVTWHSSNTKVATVKNGEVVAVGEGSCQITVTTANGHKDSCAVVVSGFPVEALALSETELTLHVKDRFQLECAVQPQEAETAIVWATSDADVVAVEEGLLKANGLGNCTITVTADNGVTAQCRVEVVLRQEERFPVGQWELVRAENRFEETEWPASGKTLVIREDLTGVLKEDGKDIAFSWWYTDGDFWYDVTGIEDCEQMTYESEEDVLILYLSEESWIFAPAK